MPFAFVTYPNPLDARVTLTPDGSAPLVSVPYTAPDGRQGQVCYVADNAVSGHGAQLDAEASGHLPLRLRGFLVLDTAAHVGRLQVDDLTLTVATEAPDGPTPPPTGARTPPQIIDEVYRTTNPNLATVEGCGQFTEDCCDALHTQHSTMWGHIAKNPGQNQYQGHAVDALMLLTNVSNAAGGVQAGIYDIIFSSASFDAKPVFNWVEPPVYELWYYPADAATRGAVVVAIPALLARHPSPRGKGK